LDRGAGIAVPRVTDQDGQLHLSLRREPSLLRACGLTGTNLPIFSEYVAELDAYEVPHDVDWALGAIMMISTECYDALGGWDESFFLYSEETDFCLRAKDAGWATRYEPRAHAMHIGGQSGQSSKTHVMQIVNRVRLYRRRHGRLTAGIYFVLALLAEASHLRGDGGRHRAAVVALLQPRRRPPELGTSSTWMPV
jgi:GT2 family glycosyltransferase